MRESQSIVDVINSQLKDLYGLDIVTGLPIFRVVWSEDQFEYRHGTYEDYVPGTNIWLRSVTETRHVPKYRQWIHARHILERLVLVPEFQQSELPAAKLSYEPLFVFRKGEDNETPEGYLPPRLDVCKFTIDSVLAAQAVATMMLTGTEQRDRPTLARYKDPVAGKSTEEIIDIKRKEIDELTNQLYGDETGLMGSTLSRNQGGGETIIVPPSFVKE